MLVAVIAESPVQIIGYALDADGGDIIVWVVITNPFPFQGMFLVKFPPVGFVPFVFGAVVNLAPDITIHDALQLTCSGIASLLAPFVELVNQGAGDTADNNTAGAMTTINHFGAHKVMPLRRPG